MTTEVHASSIIHPDTKIDNSCKVGPYAIIEEGVKIFLNYHILENLK